MKLKEDTIDIGVNDLLTFTAQAAQGLSPERAASLQPFERINITDRFNAINDAATAVSRRADQIGAATFYVVNSNDANKSGNWRVTADLYRQDAPDASIETQYWVFNGVKKLPRTEANLLELCDTISVNGFYRNQRENNDAISKAAKAKGADSYYIVRQINVNQGGNQFATVFVLSSGCVEARSAKPEQDPGQLRSR